MNSASAASSESDFLAILTQVATAFPQKHNRPPAQAVVKALLEAEKATRQQHLSYPLESLLGQWRLCFIAPRDAHFKGNTPIGKGFYLPQIAAAQISFYTPEQPCPPEQLEETADNLAIGNQVQVGFCLLRLTGPARYAARKNLLAFELTQLQFSLLGQTLYQGGVRGGAAKAKNFASQPIANLPFFAFFLITESCIAARGRGGGLALWVKDKG